LQEEMFGGHFAGEYFFRNVTDLLNRPESAEVADVLELHALCLLLGYRGRFAFGDAVGDSHHPQPHPRKDRPHPRRATLFSAP
jgi:type VI protein secretion system component VasF